MTRHDITTHYTRNDNARHDARQPKKQKKDVTDLLTYNVDDY